MTEKSPKVIHARHPKGSREDLTKWDKTKRAASRLGVAAICAIPPADLALSDAVGLKIYTGINDAIELENKAAERTLEVGANSGVIMFEVMGIGMVVARNRRMRTIFGRYDEYLEEKYEDMSLPRKAVSYTVNSPLLALATAGKGVEKVGTALDNKTDNKIISTVGKGIVDIGTTNVIGTNGVIMQEVVSGKPPSTKRIAWLGAAMTGSWMGLAEGLRGAYGKFPTIRPPMDFLGNVFNTLTTVDAIRPWETPVASITMGSIAVGLAVSGHNLNKYVEKKEAEEASAAKEKSV